MCVNGVNVGQFKGTIEQIDEEVALVRRWAHRAYHTAADGKQPKTAAKLQEAQTMLDDVRALLEEAADLTEREAADSPDVTVSLV
jgi:hypothetical protein